MESAINGQSPNGHARSSAYVKLHAGDHSNHFESLRAPAWRHPETILTPLKTPMVHDLPDAIHEHLQQLYIECFGRSSDFVYAPKVFVQNGYNLPPLTEMRARVKQFEGGVDALISSRQWGEFITPTLSEKASQNWHQRHRNGLAARAVGWLTLLPNQSTDSNRPEFALYVGVELNRGNPPVCASAERIIDGTIRSCGFERCVIGATIWDERLRGRGILAPDALAALRRQAHPGLDTIPTIVYRKAAQMTAPEPQSLRIPVQNPYELKELELMGVSPNVVRQRDPALYTPIFFRLNMPPQIAYVERPSPTHNLIAFVRDIEPYMSRAVRNSTALGVHEKLPPGSKAHVAAFVLFDRREHDFKAIMTVNGRDEWSSQCGCAETVASGLHDYLGDQYELRAVVLGSPDYHSHGSDVLGKPSVCGTCCAVLGESINLNLRSGNLVPPSPENDVLLLSLALPRCEQTIITDDCREYAVSGEQPPTRIDLASPQWLSGMNANAYLASENKAISTSRIKSV